MTEEDVFVHAILTEADDLSKAHKVVEDTLSKSDTELQTLFGEWKGKGANAAEIKYDETIKPHAQELSKQIKTLVTEGQRLANLLRSALKEHYGIRSEKLAEFNVQPFRGRRLKAKPAPEGSGTPEPSQSPPVAPKTAVESIH